MALDFRKTSCTLHASLITRHQPIDLEINTNTPTKLLSALVFIEYMAGKITIDPRSRGASGGGGGLMR